LVEVSLVRRLAVDGEVSRWSMLQSIRDFAEQRLETTGEAAAVRERHARWCLGFARLAGAALAGAEQAAWLDQLEREHDNARAALRWSGVEGRVDVQLELATALASFWQMRGYLSEGRRWLEEALARAAAGDDHWLQAMVEAGILAQAQGDNDAAAGWFERALALARSAGDRGREAAFLNNLGAVALWRGEMEAAERLFREALMTAEAGNDRRRRADALANLGAIAHYQGDVATALARYMEGVAVWRDLQDAYGIADMLLNIVQLLAPATEHRERARAAGEEALSRYRALRDPQGEALALSSLGLLAMTEGQLEQAAERFEASLALFRQIEDLAGEARALGNLGLVTLDRGDVPQAAERLAAALRLATEVEDQDAIAYWLEGMAAMHLAQQDDGRAARLYGAVAALRDRIAIPRPAELACRFAANEVILRDRLKNELEATWAAGRALSLAEATGEALADDPRTSVTPADEALQLLDNLLGFTANG
jgi:tetratricopeptide (TPR) repeat protein